MTRVPLLHVKMLSPEFKSGLFQISKIDISGPDFKNRYIWTSPDLVNIEIWTSPHLENREIRTSQDLSIFESGPDISIFEIWTSSKNDTYTPASPDLQKYQIWTSPEFKSGLNILPSLLASYV